MLLLVRLNFLSLLAAAIPLLVGTPVTGYRIATVGFLSGARIARLEIAQS